MKNDMVNFPTFEELMASGKTGEFIESTHPYMRLIMQYRCAMLEVRTKFEVLDAELSMNGDRNPIESISCRIKKPMSIVEKLKRKNLDVTLENVEKHLNDVAGIRVICSFTDDIYLLAEKICAQDDVRLKNAKDYIKNPKPNGYRSLHLILEIPVFFADEKKWLPVEVQLRTIAMDFWASIEHKMNYKKNISENEAYISSELKKCADTIHEMDLRMQEISRMIDGQPER